MLLSSFDSGSVIIPILRDAELLVNGQPDTLCIKLVINKNYIKMHSQQNIKKDAALSEVYLIYSKMPLILLTRNWRDAKLSNILDYHTVLLLT